MDVELELPEEARGLLDAVVAIGSDLDLRGVLRRIVEAACQLTHAEYGVLAILDDEGAIAELVAHGVPADAVDLIGHLPVGHGLIGLVPQARRPVRVDHVGDHPVFGGFPAGHPVIDRFLGAPVVVGDQTYGHLYLGKAVGRAGFTATDQALVEALGRAAAVMIVNARAFEESERHRAWLEGVARVTTALDPSLPDDQALTDMVAQVRELARAASVALVDLTSERLDITASSGATAEDLALVVKNSGDDIVRAAVVGELTEIDGGREDQPVLLVPVRTELAAPAVLLIDGATAWGTLEGVERGLLVALAEHLGLTLDRTQALRDRHELLLAKDRDRIARDLHDLVIQRLYATGLVLQSTRELPEGDELRGRVGTAIRDLDLAIADLRATIFELGRGGGRSVHEEARDLMSDYEPLLGFRPALRVSGQVDRSLTPAAADSLLLALREALSNMARHARATSALVELSASRKWVRMRVSDNGVGFDPSAPGRRSGLDNVRHRAEALGGRFTLDSAEGAGCRIEWAVPAIG